MKQNRFVLFSAVILLLVLGGGVYKHTALRDQRAELTYQYKVLYTVDIPDVDESIVDMYFDGMGLYLDSQTVAGVVQETEKHPAASGRSGKYDVTLHVFASGSRLTADGYGSYTLTENNLCTFISRFITFDGYITEVNEV